MTLRRLVLAMVLAVLAPGVASACPSCKEAVASQSPGEAERVSRGFSASIVLMLAMPITLVGGGAFAVTRAVRRGMIPEL